MGDIYDATEQAIVMSPNKADRVKVYPKKRRCKYEENGVRCGQPLCSYNESTKYCFAHSMKGTEKDDKKLEELKRQRITLNNKKARESMTEEKRKKKLAFINKQIKKVMDG